MAFKPIISIVCACLTMLSFNVSAIPADVNAGGQITGGASLDIGDKAWDMALHNINSFTSEYASYPGTSVQDRGVTIDATLTLSDFLTLATPSPFALKPRAFSGCSDQVECFIASAYDYDIIADMAWDDAVYARGSTITYGKWERSEPSPKPLIAILLASSLVVFGLARRSVRI